MRTELVRIELDDEHDDFLVAEISYDEETEREVAGGAFAATLSTAFDSIEPALGMIVTRLRGATRAPDQLSVGFGLKFGGETGLIFAKGKTEASLTVTLTWTKPPSAPAVPGADAATS